MPTTPPDVQAQLRSLAIPKDQRPDTGARAGGRSLWKGLAVGVILVAAAWIGLRFLRPGLSQRIQSAVTTSGQTPAVSIIQVTAGREPQAQPVLTATGKIVSDHRVAVSTKVSGQIVALSFEQGDRVERGQVLARVEDVVYRARRDEAAARLERSLANLAFQKINFERVSRLVQAESAPDIEFADAKRALEEGQAQVEADRATLQWAQKALSDCEVVAPIAGVVLTRNVEVGDFVAAEGGRGAMANAQLATIADMTKLRVEVDISELDIVRIRKDMPCTITPDAYKDRRYHGFVMWLDPGANYSKATVQTKVRIENPDEFLRVEGSGQVSFFNERRDESSADAAPSIWIPASACRPNPSSNNCSVFRVMDGRLQSTTVRLGRRQGDQLEIVSGLTPGESIVAERVDQLSEGQRVGK
jgi:RND family efflux transporter MFP subunit